MLYLDASVLVACYVPEQRSLDAETLVLSEPECLVSDLTVAEGKNAIIRRGKRGEILAVDVATALDRIDAHLAAGYYRPVTLGRTVFWEVPILSQRSPTHLRTADALHLAMALMLGCPLATFDVVLAAAAAAEGVRVLPA
jgi:predicted nucleic acid-binding protein